MEMKVAGNRKNRKVDSSLIIKSSPDSVSKYINSGRILVKALDMPMRMARSGGIECRNAKGEGNPATVRVMSAAIKVVIKPVPATKMMDSRVKSAYLFEVKLSILRSERSQPKNRRNKDDKKVTIKYRREVRMKIQKVCKIPSISRSLNFFRQNERKADMSKWSSSICEAE